MKHEKKIEDLLAKVGSFVIQKESMKLSLIPTKLLKSKDSENEFESSSNEYYYYDEDEKDGSSDEDEQDDSSNRPSWWETGIDKQFI